jgi:hypothetical protein
VAEEMAENLPLYRTQTGLSRPSGVRASIVTEANEPMRRIKEITPPTKMDRVPPSYSSTACDPVSNIYLL